MKKLLFCLFILGAMIIPNHINAKEVCELKVDEFGNILNQKEYDECLAGMVDTLDFNDDKPKG